MYSQFMMHGQKNIKLWFSICWSGVELRFMCPVYRMLLY